MEIERKFWIDRLPDLPEVRHSEIEQAYLCTAPVELRIRRRRELDTGEVTYRLCIKSIGTLSRHEVETPLSREQYEELESMLDQPPIRKEFHTYRLEDGRILECSIVDNGVFSYAEVEFPTEEEALSWQPPDFLGKETTYEKGVSMREYWNKRKNTEWIP